MMLVLEVAYWSLLQSFSVGCFITLSSLAIIGCFSQYHAIIRLLEYLPPIVKHSQLTTAKDLSYSPYSKFRVGAVILTETGEYISGANIENASYGACICAEQTTVTKAVTMGFYKFKALAVSTDLSDKIGSPCGICRQVIREFGRKTPIYLFNHDGTDFFRVLLSDLLPMSFGPSDLGEPEFDDNSNREMNIAG